MTLAGWITMIISLVAVWGGTLLCFRKVLETPKVEEAPPSFGP